ncbi:VQ motif-containing protein [Quillaja saponaria]|uniref:VQ motif-containing protein n=1 Tax=Quillaja saponaria TaxID=32244 RepID=A0AAD7PY52_QUISA|nr:VQ motif-containing protein [Quillaja saponaria]
MDSQARKQLQGPKPSALAICRNSTKIKKQILSQYDHHQSRRHDRSPPVVVYLRSPQIIHARPEEFMGLVQKLTSGSN